MAKKSNKEKRLEINNIESLIQELERKLEYISSQSAELQEEITSYNEAEDLVTRKKLYEDSLGELIDEYLQQDPEAYLHDLEVLKSTIVSIVQEKYSNIPEEKILAKYKTPLDHILQLISKLKLDQENLKDDCFQIQGDTLSRELARSYEGAILDEEEADKHEEISRKLFEILFDPDNSKIVYVYQKYEEIQQGGGPVHNSPRFAQTLGYYKLRKLQDSYTEHHYAIGDVMEDIFYDKTISPDDEDYFELTDEAKALSEDIALDKEEALENPESFSEIGTIEIGGIQIEVSQRQLIMAGISPEMVGWHTKEISSTEIAKITKGEKKSVVEKIKSLFSRLLGRPIEPIDEPTQKYLPKSSQLSSPARLQTQQQTKPTAPKQQNEQNQRMTMER